MIKQKQTILIVDDIPFNLEIMDEILNKHYSVRVAKNGPAALKIAAQTQPDLILLDIMMPDMDGYEVCSRLKADPATKDIPVIFVTAKDNKLDEAKGLEIGAVDYIIKPLSTPIVLARVKTQLSLHKQNRELERLVAEKTNEIIETRSEIIRRLSIAAEYKDNETWMHIYRVSNYCQIIGLQCGFPPAEADILHDASTMHDVGKIGVPDSILQKHGNLNEEEFAIVKTHCDIGARIIGDHKSELLNSARAIAREHHEKWDGTGYPDGISGENISLHARITAVADVFDALTSKRPYKNPWSIEKAFEHIQSESGKQFDPRVVEAFVQSIEKILIVKDRYSD